LRWPVRLAAILLFTWFLQGVCRRGRPPGGGLGSGCPCPAGRRRRRAAAGNATPGAPGRAKMFAGRSGPTQEASAAGLRQRSVAAWAERSENPTCGSGKRGAGCTAGTGKPPDPAPLGRELRAGAAGEQPARQG